VVSYTQIKLRGLSPQGNYTDPASDRRMSAKLVPPFADKGCRVVSATDRHGPILGFLDRRYDIHTKFNNDLFRLSIRSCREKDDHIRQVG
jgi:hypothetical protein